MSERSQTSIYEMREMADLSDFHYNAEQLITPETVERFPHRDVDVLREAAAECDGIRRMTEQIGSNHSHIRQWGRVYGIDLPREQSALPQKLEEMDASEVSGD